MLSAAKHPYSNGTAGDRDSSLRSE